MTEKSRILLVDDIEENLIALEAAIRRDDAEIVSARSGMQALELILQYEFALAFVDVQMPEMDGFELAELMRGAERSKYIPIIFVTAGAGDVQRMFRGYESGAVDFLFKPVDPHMLRQKTETFIGLDQQRKLLAQQFQRIQESESLLRAVMDATPALIYAKDLHGRYITANRRYGELLGELRGDVPGAAQATALPTDYEVFPQDTADQFRANDLLAISRGAAIQVEERIEQPDGIHTYLASKVPLRNERGEILGVCAVANDISVIKKMESDLEHAVQAREDVLAVVSHDIRNFLQSIKSGVQMLVSRADKLSPQVKTTIQGRIQSTVDLMTRVITDLMDMASIRTGRIAVEIRPEVGARLVTEAIAIYEPMAQEKGIALQARCELGDQVVVACDRERILQVLTNLLGNSIKFCRAEDRITVSASQVDEGVQIAVSDSGPGIASSDLPLVFDAYWSSTQNRSKGTGLGLYITKRIIEAHGSRIWIQSELGVGTTVFFTLPLASAV
ncbi:MAG TPA: ATP-binding protein [Steroidobacteraceae bacterium]|jgi:PAS domain S-box-containing protein